MRVGDGDVYIPSTHKLVPSASIRPSETELSEISYQPITLDRPQRRHSRHTVGDEIDAVDLRQRVVEVDPKEYPILEG